MTPTPVTLFPLGDSSTTTTLSLKNSGEPSIPPHCIFLTIPRWMLWKDNPSLKSYRIDPSIQLQECIVPTNFTSSVEFLTQLLLHGKKPVLLHGNSGMGKTLEATSLMVNGLNEGYLPLTVNLTLSTTSQYLQDTLESNLERRKGEILEYDVIVVDADNIPRKTCPTNYGKNSGVLCR